VPLAAGCLDYFPDALAAVARLSKKGNDKHNPGQPLHWSREKSGDHADCILRHMTERGKMDETIDELHDVEVAWRALAQCQLALEQQAQKREVLAEDTKIWVEWSAPIEAGYERADAPTRKVEINTPVQRPAPKPKVTFWYLATPYTNYQPGHEAAAWMANIYAARLMDLGVPVFCPISHSHPIAGQLPPARKTDHDFWMKVDKPMMDAASGLIVVTLSSWDQSRGIKKELEIFRLAGKPVVFWHPDCHLPAGFDDHGTYRG